MRRAGAVLALVLSATAARAAAATAAPPAPSTLVIGTLADPVTLDAHRATDLVATAVLANLCEPLVRFRADGTHPEPALATTWATLDNRTWTFTLREGVRFHDGTPFDADAVVANVADLVRRRALSGTAERLGPAAVALTLEQPNAAFLATLSQPLYCLLSPKALLADPHPPVGTGPFKLAQARPGLQQLEALPAHWGGAARVQRLEFQRFPDERALVEALLAGRVDVTSALGLPSLERLREAPQLTLDSRTGLNVCFLSIENEKPPFRDARVRQALARALDREAIVRRLLGGHGEAARTPLPPLLAGHGRQGPPAGRDLTSARRLLEQAGLASGFETSLTFSSSPRPYLPAPRALAEQLAADLAQVGVRARLNEVPGWSDYIERATNGAYELALLGWQADTPDPNDFLSALLSSEAIGSTNRSRYKSGEMDALLKRGRRLADPAERQAVYREAQALFLKDLPWVPLYHLSVFSVYGRNVHGLTPGPTGNLRYDKAWKAH